MFGALGGTIPLRLSFTDLSLGMPPAKMSPNWGAAGMGEADDRRKLPEGCGGAVFTDIFRSRIGLDLSTVTAFFKVVPF